MFNKDLINKVTKFIAIIMFVAIFICVIFIDTNVTYTYSNNIKIKNIYILGIIFLLFTISVIAKILVNKLKIKQSKFVKKINKYSNLIIYTIFFILFILQIIIVKNIYFETSWDVEHLMNAARGFAKNGVFENNTYFEIYPYFSVYPNNLFLAQIFAIIGKVVYYFNTDKIYEILIYIGIILVDLSGIIMVKTIKNISDKKSLQFLGTAIFVIFIGLSPWFLVPYSDTYSIIFPISVLYNYTKKEKKWFNYVLIGLFSYCGYLIKPTGIIILIAIAIIEIYKSLFNLKNKEKIKIYLKNIVLVLSGIIIIFVFKFCLNTVINYKVDRDYSFSLWHYFMMGINQDTTGCFNSGDVMESLSIDTYEHRVENNKTKFIERIKGLSLKEAGIFYLKKVLVNYNDGTFAWGREGWFYKILNENDSKLAVFLKSFYYNDGENFVIFTCIMQTIWIMILIFIIVTVIIDKIDYNKSVMFLTLIGITLFTLIFEGRARYLYLYSTYYIILAVIGIGILINHKKEV